MPTTFTTFSFVPTLPEWQSGDGWTTYSIENNYGTTISLNVGHYSTEERYASIEGEEYYLYDVACLTIAYNADKPFRIVDHTLLRGEHSIDPNPEIHAFS